MTVKIQQYSSNYKKRKSESFKHENIKKVRNNYFLNSIIPLNIQVSISTLTDNSIPATVCLEGEGETLSYILFRIKILFFQILLFLRLSGEVNFIVELFSNQQNQQSSYFFAFETLFMINLFQTNRNRKHGDIRTTSIFERC